MVATTTMARQLQEDHHRGQTATELHHRGLVATKIHRQVLSIIITVIADQAVREVRETRQTTAADRHTVRAAMIAITVITTIITPTLVRATISRATRHQAAVRLGAEEVRRAVAEAIRDHLHRALQTGSV